MKQWIPWQAKIAAKIVLARSPIPYTIWRRLNLFKHGTMTDVSYALGVFRTHVAVARAGPAGGDMVALELGPGDSLLSAVVARLMGVSRIHLIDAGAFASTEIALYRTAAEQLMKELGAGGIEPARWRDVGDMLADCRATYGTAGLQSLAAVPDASVDLSWSHAVLEHVRKREVGPTMRELRRIARPHGVSSHQVDLSDHLGGKLNNLRFSPEVWEGDFFSRSGFYTNRVRYAEWRRIFTDAGFEAAQLMPQRWDTVPTARHALHPVFRPFDDDDLKVRGFRAVLYPK